MGRDDWFRRTTWTEQDQRDFFERNARGRGADRKAQYIRIQAVTLLKTGRPELIRSALILFELMLKDYPDALDVAPALTGAGECNELLGAVDSAIAYYRRALDRERARPGWRTGAAYRLAKLAVESKNWPACAEAIEAMESHGDPVFPSQAYYRHGATAALMDSRGDPATARQFAVMALEASAVRATALGYGRGHLGTVQNIDTRFHRLLANLVAA